MKDLVLIDGNNLAHRFFWRFQRQKREQGASLHFGDKETSVLYSFLRELILIEKRYPNSEKVMVWDGGYMRRKAETDIAIQQGLVKTGYKGTRKEMESDDKDNFDSQMSHLKTDVLPNLAILQLQIQGFEADDIIYSYTLKYPERRCICVTSDKDYFQALNDHVLVVDLMNDEVWDSERFTKEYGFTPNHYVDYGALMGDPSDNIPGVPKCGEVSAKKLVREHGTVENVLKALAVKEKKSKLEESVLFNTELLRLSYSLKKMDVINVPDISIIPKTEADVKKMLIDWGCVSLLKDADKLCGKNNPIQTCFI